MDYDTKKLKTMYDEMWDSPDATVELYYYEDTHLVSSIVIDGREYMNDALDDEIEDWYGGYYGHGGTGLYSTEGAWRE